MRSDTLSSCIRRTFRTPRFAKLPACRLPRVLWIDAAHDEDAHWAAEQTLREGAAGAVLLWSHAVADRPLRRLQLAAEAGESLALSTGPPMTLDSSSPAALRIVLRPAPPRWKLKC